MRPCRQCRMAIENQIAVCPQCGAVQAEGPRANPKPAEPRPGIARRFLVDLVNSLWFNPWLCLFVLALPLALGGAVGYLAYGETGAIVGAIVAIIVGLGLVLLADSGADGT